MQLNVYAIRDIKANVYNTPFFLCNDPQAIRALAHLVNTPQGESYISQFPEDFQLFQLGTYDDESGKLFTLDAPRFIVNAYALLKPVFGPVQPSKPEVTHE